MCKIIGASRYRFTRRKKEAQADTYQQRGTTKHHNPK